MQRPQSVSQNLDQPKSRKPLHGPHDPILCNQLNPTKILIINKLSESLKKTTLTLEGKQFNSILSAIVKNNLHTTVYSNTFFFITVHKNP